MARGSNESDAAADAADESIVAPTACSALINIVLKSKYAVLFVPGRTAERLGPPAVAREPGVTAADPVPELAVANCGSMATCDGFPEVRPRLISGKAMRLFGR